MSNTRQKKKKRKKSVTLQNFTEAYSLTNEKKYDV